jgi:hypothetical protein
MPKFQVLCRIDAFIDYVAEVEADTAEEAAELASDDHNSYKWVRDSESEFDDRVYVTLDAEGNEVESTQCGDL